MCNTLHTIRADLSLSENVLDGIETAGRQSYQPSPEKAAPGPMVQVRAFAL